AMRQVCGEDAHKLPRQSRCSVGAPQAQKQSTKTKLARRAIEPLRHVSTETSVLSFFHTKRVVPADRFRVNALYIALSSLNESTAYSLPWCFRGKEEHQQNEKF